MDLTLLFLIASAVLICLFTALLHYEKIQNLVYFALVALIILFDFAVLSLDKVYLLHEDQDEAFYHNMQSIEMAMEQQLSLYKELTEMQLGFTVQAITQNITEATQEQVRKKVQWRDNLVTKLNNLSFKKEVIDEVEQGVNLAVHRYLMEQLNKTTIEHLGHRIYGEFLRKRPREEWTDKLFVNELESFLKKEGLLKDVINQRLKAIKEFEKSGKLI